MAWTSPRTWVTSEVVTASLLNTHVKDNSSFLHDPPTCRVYNTTNISIPNTTDTALTFDTERFDTDTMHSTSGSTGRITFTTAGKYLVGAGVNLDTSAVGGIRLAQIRLNGTTVIASQTGYPSSATSARLTPVTLYAFAAADYVEVVVHQDSGGALNVTAAGNYSPEFWATWVSG